MPLPVLTIKLEVRDFRTTELEPGIMFRVEQDGKQPCYCHTPREVMSLLENTVERVLAEQQHQAAD